MSKLAFFVDHIFQRSPDGQIYTMGGKFPAMAWSTYLEIFDEMTVVSRVRDQEKVETLSLSSRPNVSFDLTGARRGFKRFLDGKENRSIVERAVEQADAVVARLPSELGLLACEHAKKLNKPYMIELVACPWDSLWNHGSLAGRLYAPIMKSRTAKATKDAPAVRYVTDRFLQDRYPTNGQSFAASNVELSDDFFTVVRKTRAKNTGKITFGTIGALHTKLKGVHDATKALSQVLAANEGLEFEYRIVGEGDPSWIDLAGLDDRVFFDGTLTAGQQIRDWLDSVDIYLQPSYQEGLPRALIEALSRGCLAAGSTAGGIPELLPETRTHQPGDVERLASIIGSMIAMDADEASEEVDRNIAVAGKYKKDTLTEIRLNSLATLKPDDHGNRAP